jgi:hypothetical protein
MRSRDALLQDIAPDELANIRKAIRDRTTAERLRSVAE